MTDTGRKVGRWGAESRGANTPQEQTLQWREKQIEREGERPGRDAPEPKSDPQGQREKQTGRQGIGHPWPPTVPCGWPVGWAPACPHPSFPRSRWPTHLAARNRTQLTAR